MRFAHVFHAIQIKKIRDNANPAVPKTYAVSSHSTTATTATSKGYLKIENRKLVHLSRSHQLNPK